jgi:hypothetical protein
MHPKVLSRLAIAAILTVTFVLSSVKSSGTATVTDLVNISTLLQCTGGTLALGTNLVTLLSTSTTTAQVGNSTGGTYTGSANIQRYDVP